MISSQLPTNTKQVQIIEIVRYDVVHCINITLTANNITVHDIHSGSKSSYTFGQCVILCGFPVPDKYIVGRRYAAFGRRHPRPNCRLECESCILFNVFGMVQQVNLNGLAYFPYESRNRMVEIHHWVLVRSQNSSQLSSKNTYNYLRLVNEGWEVGA
ncbi:protein kinase protein with adenine nucleotidealpha hydrolases-like domain, partial [Striga asiatica]